ncbi:MAG: biopolymer transporter ExbB [Deltaproteobacteria bacterium]|nr:biopolymer transporter ExbB [Deltaproteobacteria bacterium]
MKWELVEQLQTGGPVMIPIAILSVLGLMSLLERVWSLPRSRYQGKEELRTYVRKTMEREEQLQLLEEKGRQLVGMLHKKTFLLGIVASVAPMLGLLGTVLGMIVTFSDIQEVGVGDAGALAGGISQALMTTFVGLCVGIPALVAHRWVLREIDDIALDWEESCRAELEKDV